MACTRAGRSFLASPEKETPRIALDGMGGDRAPEAVLDGVAELMAGDDAGSFRLLVTGPEDYLRPRLAQYPSVEVIHAPQVIGMDESPATACRTKKDSSMMVMANLVAEGRADAAVSMGNSGAAMASALLTCGRLPRVQRPAIAIPMPSYHGWAILIDAGANTDCKASHLAQFAVMGEAYAKRILGIPKPRVGLLSNGEEEGKGTAVVAEAHDLIKDLSLEFVGNVEGRDLFNGRADVVVCDGFAGNVLLKGAEGVAEMIFTLLKEELQKTLRSRLGGLLSKPAFRNFYKRLDYAEQGSAPLLGVKGVFMIGHGKSPGRAIANAVRTAARVVREKVNDAIQASLAGAPGRTAVGLNE